MHNKEILYMRRDLSEKIWNNLILLTIDQQL